MRRGDRKIDDRAVIDGIIARCRVLRLGLCRAGQPYVVPLCFGYDGRALYFHAAAEGKKIELLRENPRVCVELDIPGDLLPAAKACGWSMSYESVIGTGTAEILETEQQKREGLGWIMRQYSDQAWTFPERVVGRIVVVRIDLEEITGKARF